MEQKTKQSNGEEHFFCFQITQTTHLEILIQTLTSLKNHYKQNSVKVQVSYIQTKWKLNTKKIKHNEIVFFLYPYVSEVGKATVFSVLQKGKLRPSKAVSFFHKDGARTKTQISSSQPSLFPVAQVTFYDKQERNRDLDFGTEVMVFF